MQVGKCPLLGKGRGNYRGFRTQTFGKLLLHVEISLEYLKLDNLVESSSIFLHWARIFPGLSHVNRNKTRGKIPFDGVVASLRKKIEESGYPII